MFGSNYFDARYFTARHFAPTEEGITAIDLLSPEQPTMVCPVSGTAFVNHWKGIRIRKADYNFHVNAMDALINGIGGVIPLVGSSIQATNQSGQWDDGAELLDPPNLDETAANMASTSTEGEVHRVDWDGWSIPAELNSSDIVKDVILAMLVRYTSPMQDTRGDSRIYLQVALDGELLGYADDPSTVQVIYLYEQFARLIGHREFTVGELNTLTASGLELTLTAFSGDRGWVTKWWAHGANLNLICWDPDDSNYDRQSQWEVQIADNETFSPVAWSKLIRNDKSMVVVPPRTLEGDTDYWARARVWDDDSPSNSSGWEKYQIQRGQARQKWSTFKTMPDSIAKALVTGGTFTMLAEVWFRKYVSGVAWSPHGSLTDAYQCTFSQSAQPVQHFYLADIEEDGEEGGYTRVWTEAEVTAAGTFYYDGTTVTLRTTDSRHPAGFKDLGVSLLPSIDLSEEGFEIQPKAGGIPGRTYLPLVSSIPGVSFSLSDLSKGRRGTLAGSLVFDNIDGWLDTLMAVAPVELGRSGRWAHDDFPQPFTEEHLNRDAGWLIDQARLVLKVAVGNMPDDVSEVYRGQVELRSESIGKKPKVNITVKGQDAVLRNKKLADRLALKVENPNMRESDENKPVGEIVFDIARFEVPMINLPTSRSGRCRWEMPEGTASVIQMLQDVAVIPSSYWAYHAASNHVYTTTPVPSSIWNSRNSAKFEAVVRGANSSGGLGQAGYWLTKRVAPQATVDYDSFTSLRHERMAAAVHAESIQPASSVIHTWERSANAHLIRRPDGVYQAVEGYPQIKLFERVTDGGMPGYGNAFQHSYWNRRSGLGLCSNPLVITEDDFREDPKQGLDFSAVNWKVEITGERSSEYQPYHMVKRSWFARSAWRTEKSDDWESYTHRAHAPYRMGEEPMSMPVRTVEFYLGEIATFAYPGTLIITRDVPNMLSDAGQFDWDVFMVTKQKLNSEFDITLKTRWLARLDDAWERVE